MREGLIGVIVPVYKVEKYITECIESILAQTYTNFRLILVDDGTPDNAGNICDEYAEKDSRITVIHQENAGVTRARARGVEEASDCEWITFIDSDDTVAKNMLEEFCSYMDLNTDLVVNEPGLKQPRTTTRDYIHALISSNHKINAAPWGKLFRRELFCYETLNISREIVVGEDLIMNVRIAFSSKKECVSIINKPVYNYRLSETSITARHTRTPLYEELFQQHLIKSIPAELFDEFLEDTIKNRMRLFTSFWGYKYQVDDMKDTEFYKGLRSDIKRTGYKLSLIESIVFYSSNPIIRFIAINTKKLNNKIISMFE